MASKFPELMARVTGAAEDLARILEFRAGERIVFAESCTAGLIAATMATQPGISRYLCGSTVTYRDEVKEAWLGVSPELLTKFSAVSAEVTQAMVIGILQRTPQATWGLAITGHLGPAAPPELDGLVFIAIGTWEHVDGQLAVQPVLREQSSIRLIETDRVCRQYEATEYALRRLLRHLIQPIDTTRPPIA